MKFWQPSFQKSKMIQHFVKINRDVVYICNIISSCLSGSSTKHSDLMLHAQCNCLQYMLCEILEISLFDSA